MMEKACRAAENDFCMDCEVIDLSLEYSGWHEKAKWAICTSCTESELRRLYPEELGQYVPYILLTHEQFQAIAEYDRNEKKYDMRRKRTEYFQEMDHWNYHSMEQRNNIFERLEMEEQIQIFRRYLEKRKTLQRMRLNKYIFEDYSYKEIAVSEGISRQAAEKYIKRAMEKFRKYYRENFSE